MLGYFCKKIYQKNFQKSPNLVTLLLEEKSKSLHDNCPSRVDGHFACFSFKKGPAGRYPHVDKLV